jgi:hypothetical protein
MDRFSDLVAQDQIDDTTSIYQDDMDDYYTPPYSNNYPVYTDSPF